MNVSMNAKLERRVLIYGTGAGPPNNLLYLMMLGSTNYISAVLIKLVVSIDAGPAEYGKAFAEVLAICKAYLQEAADSYQTEPLQPEGVCIQYLMRRLPRTKEQSKIMMNCLMQLILSVFG